LSCNRRYARTHSESAADTALTTKCKA